MAPKIIAHSADSEVRHGNMATLRCRARGHPVPTLTWLKDGRTFSDSRISQPKPDSLKVFIRHCLCYYKYTPKGLELRPQYII